ncbi:hypothetical protein PROFUN_10326 [Planoprotostelium fungivorum]|uniref:Uncharacterized protein n=1 Tax=Planoprotostelium fungivorum TaxID=1890364 RepID=A0A2P6NDT2_9EUKA|nr:hypothetical protein PROFUN_10326 [Planoprotostelium fungivorum]
MGDTTSEYSWSSIQHVVQTFRIQHELKRVCREANLSQSGSKQALIDRIRDWVLNEKDVHQRRAIFDLIRQLQYPQAVNTQPTPPPTVEPLPQYAIQKFEHNPFLAFERTISYQRVQPDSAVLSFKLTPLELDSQHCVQLLSYNHQKSEGVHVWPPTVYEGRAFGIMINNKVHTAKRATKKEKDKISDITSLCGTGINHVKVNHGGRDHTFVVNLYRKVSPEFLIEKIMRDHSLTSAMGKERVRRFFSSQEEEIQQISSKISLLDPLSKSIIKTPTRAKTCHHLQCFELDSFIRMNERTPKWQCPNCYKTADYNDLEVDNYFADILEACGKMNADIEDIEMSPDGEWSIPQNKAKKQKVVHQSTPSVVVLDLSDDDEVTPPPKPSTYHRVPPPPPSHEDMQHPAARSGPIDTAGRGSTSIYNRIFSTTSGSTSIYNRTFSATRGSTRYSTTRTRDNDSNGGTCDSTTRPASSPTVTTPTPSSTAIKEDEPKESKNISVYHCHICRQLTVKRCSLCRSIAYCGEKCQREDWNRHKTECGNVESLQPANPHRETSNGTPPSTPHAITPRQDGPSRVFNIQRTSGWDDVMMGKRSSQGMSVPSGSAWMSRGKTAAEAIELD